jgi:hypothetical protein
MVVGLSSLAQPNGAEDSITALRFLHVLLFNTEYLDRSHPRQCVRRSRWEYSWPQLLCRCDKWGRFHAELCWNRRHDSSHHHWRVDSYTTVCNQKWDLIPNRRMQHAADRERGPGFQQMKARIYFPYKFSSGPSNPCLDQRFRIFY